MAQFTEATTVQDIFEAARAFGPWHVTGSGQVRNDRCECPFVAMGAPCAKIEHLCSADDAMTLGVSLDVAVAVIRIADNYETFQRSREVPAWSHSTLHAERAKYLPIVGIDP